MRNIKKIVTLGCIAVCAAVMLCSCGNKKALASISLASPITLQLGESKEVEITGILRDGTTVTGDELDAILKRKGMHYESSSDNVASIDQNGLLTANNSGTTEISITSQNKRLTAGAVVNVVEPLQGFQAEDIIASTKSILVPVTYTTVPEGADAGSTFDLRPRHDGSDRLYRPFNAVREQRPCCTGNDLLQSRRMVTEQPDGRRYD